MAIRRRIVKNSDKNKGDKMIIEKRLDEFESKLDEIISMLGAIVNNINNSDISLDAVSKQHSHDNVNSLKIIEAKYGAKDKWKDVTSELNDAIFEGCICVPACNFISGDPIRNVVKHLVVKYELNGEVKEEKIKEGELFVIE